MNEPKVIKEEYRDLWYKRMGERKTIHPDDYPFVGLMEWVDIIYEFK
jgi:hypothetical protein